MATLAALGVLVGGFVAGVILYSADHWVYQRDGRGEHEPSVSIGQMAVIQPEQVRRCENYAGVKRQVVRIAVGGERLIIHRHEPVM